MDLGWLDAVIDFDPARYARDMRITVRGVSGTPLLARLFDGGEPRPLPHTRHGDAVEVVVPFGDGPAALLVFDGTPAEPVPDAPPVPGRNRSRGGLGGRTGPHPGRHLARLRRRRDGRALDVADAGGEAVHVTFGPRGEQRVGDGPWTPSVWSLSRGLRKDPVHRDTLGPKGRVLSRVPRLRQGHGGRRGPLPYPAHRAAGTARLARGRGRGGEGSVARRRADPAGRPRLRRRDGGARHSRRAPAGAAADA
ncbi:hypothetical protein ACFSTC_13145 [Nonomuraea ferruginea]